MPQRVRAVDEPAQVVRAAVEVRRRPQVDAVVAPAEAPGELGDRHQLDHRDADVGQHRQPLGRGGVRPLGREGPDVHLVDDLSRAARSPSRRRRSRRTSSGRPARTGRADLRAETARPGRGRGAGRRPDGTRTGPPGASPSITPENIPSLSFSAVSGAPQSRFGPCTTDTRWRAGAHTRTCARPFGRSSAPIGKSTPACRACHCGT